MDTWVVVKIMVPLLGPLNARCRIRLRTQKGTIILTTTHTGAVVVLFVLQAYAAVQVTRAALDCPGLS